MNLRLIRAPVLGCFHDEIMKLRKKGGGYRRIAEVVSRYADHEITPSSVGKYLKRVKAVGQKFGYGDYPTSRQLGLDDRQKRFAQPKVRPQIVFAKNSEGPILVTAGSSQVPERDSRKRFQKLSQTLSRKVTESPGKSGDSVPKSVGVQPAEESAKLCPEDEQDSAVPLS